MVTIPIIRRTFECNIAVTINNIMVTIAIDYGNDSYDVWQRLPYYMVMITVVVWE